MSGVIKFFTVLAICLFVLTGCAGGSKGTGGQGFGGIVVTKQSTPVSGVIVTLLQTGISDITDVDGKFFLEASIPDGDVRFNIDTGKFQKDIIIMNLPPTAKVVNIVIQVDEDEEEAEAIDVEVTENEEHEETQKPTRTPSSSKTVSDGNGDDTGQKSPTATPLPVPTNPEIPTPTPIATSTPIPEVITPTASPTLTSTPQPTLTPVRPSVTPGPNGEDAEAEGRIEALTSNSITVRRLTFQVTGSTVVTKGDHTTISFSSLSIGDRAHVTGVWQSGVAIASRIKIED